MPIHQDLPVRSRSNRLCLLEQRYHVGIALQRIQIVHVVRDVVVNLWIDDPDQSVAVKLAAEDERRIR